MSDRDPSRRSEIARKASQARWDGEPKRPRRTEHKSSGVPERRFAAADPSRRSAWKHAYGKGGSHVSLPEARRLHAVAQAAAISWFSR